MTVHSIQKKQAFPEREATSSLRKVTLGEAPGCGSGSITSIVLLTPGPSGTGSSVVTPHQNVGVRDPSSGG